MGGGGLGGKAWEQEMGLAGNGFGIFYIIHGRQ